MVIVGILVAALALGTTIGVALGRAQAGPRIEPTTTIAGAGLPLTDRTSECTDGLNQAGRQVKALLDRAAGATAADVPGLRADATGATAAVRTARQACADLLPECSTIADAYAGWLGEALDRVNGRADGLAGTGPPTTLALGDPPPVTCTIAR